MEYIARKTGPDQPESPDEGFNWLLHGDLKNSEPPLTACPHLHLLFCAQMMHTPALKAADACTPSVCAATPFWVQERRTYAGVLLLGTLEAYHMVTLRLL
jgi:hypothetical protein